MLMHLTDLFREDAQKLKGACFHQLPVFREGTAVQRPDMFIVELIEKVPCRPVGLSVVKKNAEKSTGETTDYCIQAMKLRQTTDEWVLLLGLAISNDKAHLLVVVDNDGYVTQVEVCTASFTADPQAFNFFAVLYGAVHSLLAQYISNTAPSLVPIHGMGDIAVEQGILMCFTQATWSINCMIINFPCFNLILMPFNQLILITCLT